MPINFLDKHEGKDTFNSGVILKQPDLKSLTTEESTESKFL